MRVNFAIAALPLILPVTVKVPTNPFAFSERFAMPLESVVAINIIVLPLAPVSGTIKLTEVLATGFPYWSNTLASSLFVNGLLTIVA